MKYNWFTEFFCFMQNLNLNQPQVYIYPLPFEPPSHLLPQPTRLDWYRAPVEFPEPYICCIIDSCVWNIMKCHYSFVVVGNWDLHAVKQVAENNFACLENWVSYNMQGKSAMLDSHVCFWQFPWSSGICSCVFQRKVHVVKYWFTLKRTGCIDQRIFVLFEFGFFFFLA